MKQEFLQKLKKGDDRAFEELYNQYGEYALRVATAITRNEANGADAVQEAFIRVFNSIHNFDVNKSFDPWFYRILVNECKRSFKKNSPVLPITKHLENSSVFIENDFHRFEEYEVLYDAVSKLRDINRIPIILKYLKGFKEAEIAEILGINQNTIKSRLLIG